MPTRVGRDASRVAEEVIAHLTGLVGAKVTVTLEVEAEIPGVSDHVVRIVTENSRASNLRAKGLKRSSQGKARRPRKQIPIASPAATGTRHSPSQERGRLGRSYAGGTPGRPRSQEPRC